MKPSSTLRKACLCLAFTITTIISYSQAYLIPFGSSWKYRDNGATPTGTWKAIVYAETGWSTGNAELGYGDAPVTTVSYGGNDNNKYITTYFRKAVTIPNRSLYTGFTINVRRDDGIVVYVNGTERYRNNMPASPAVISNSTLASGSASDDGSTVQSVVLPIANFVDGNNVIAVEVHQESVTSSDVTFDLELLGNVTIPTYVAFNSSWRFWDQNSRPANWETPGFTPTGWGTGNSLLGYGDAPATTISYGPSSTNKYITAYFRKTFTVADPNAISSLSLSVIRDDGMIVYINGTEVLRENMPGGTIGHNTLAGYGVSGAEETEIFNYTIPRCVLVAGTNTIAVEVHQDAVTSSDLSMNLQLIGNITSGVNTLTRAPYLQMGNETAITLRWRTNIASLGRVRVGTVNGTYTTASASETCPTTEHEVRITGLTADTKYFYEVGLTDGTVFTSGTDYYFRTTPPANTTRKIRITAFGDCGRGTAAYQDDNLANYRSYLTANNIEPDAWILMGDNAYSTGTDDQYTSNFFGIYGSNIMRNHKLYPAPGNHDYANNSSNKYSRSMAYHRNFSVPKNGECGGVASGKQNYYSYDIGNIHFLSLDSYGIEADGTDIGTSGNSPLKTWLDADLAANTRKWVIAYWHHSPYTKSSHDSDGEADLVAIRTNFITFLETRGVDLVICGHSHAYERAYLLKNFTGAWSSFSAPAHAVSTSSAAYTSSASCPYVYNTTPANHGTVYVVAGSVGASGGTHTGFNSGPMPFSINQAGMFYFEVEDNRLDAKMLQSNGDVFDQFTIMKDVNKTTNFNISNGSSQLLRASWPLANYTWSTGAATTRSISVTPPNNATTNYTVTDNFGCVTDQFSVTTSVILPVSVLNYTARLVNSKVLVSWSTSMESNNDHFTVERSSNGRDFTAIGTITGAGNSSQMKNYSFEDPAPLPGTSYYRLSQTNYDNHTEYLGIRRIDNIAKEFEVKTLSGQPQTLVLQIQSSVTGAYQLNVFDLQGRKVKEEVLNLQIETIRKEIPLAPGIYIWELKNNKGEAMLQKVVVQ